MSTLSEQISRRLKLNGKTKRPLVLASVMLGMFMSAIEATIIATAMPSIVADLGGFSLFSWAFSVYLLMQVITIPVYGKLADLFGRKLVFNVGVIIFLVGSILCGFARTMNILILFRVIQGIGAGAIQPIATTIVGDIYTLEERGKIQGYLGSVWGISAIVGPAVGGLIVKYIDWAWVFWINIPLGLISIAGITIFLKEDIVKKRHKIDYLGTLLLFMTVSAMMVVFVLGGTRWPWLSAPVILLSLLSVFCLFAFIAQEKRASEPIVPLSIWKHPLIVVANLASLTSGVVVIGISIYLPTFVQGVMERSPTTAGFVLAMMSIGWPLSSAFASKAMMKFGLKKTALGGGIILTIGTTFFLTLSGEQSPLWAGMGSFLVGVGMGLATTTFIVSVQNSVEWNLRGVATASNMFMRTLGTTIGASLLGGILNAGIIRHFKGQGEAGTNLDISLTNEILDPIKRDHLPTGVIQIVQEALTLSLHQVYLAVFILALISIAIIGFWPKPAKVDSYNDEEFSSVQLGSASKQE